MSNVEIVVEEENPEDPDLFGLYTGIPLTERDSGYAGALPDKIEIYRLPLEEEFGHDPDAARGGDPRSPSSTSWPITSASTTIASTTSAGGELGRTAPTEGSRFQGRERSCC